MTGRFPLPKELAIACRRHDVTLTRFVFVATIRTQTMDLLEDGCLYKRYRISTSRFGIGQISGSNCTPLGLHRIAEKIGGGYPVGTVFRARQPIGLTWDGMPNATIAHRILWLEGMEPGFNRGGNVDTHARYIYIHGLGDEPTLGKPASHGCIHLAANDLMPLFDFIPSGTLVWIQR